MFCPSRHIQSEEYLAHFPVSSVCPSFQKLLVQHPAKTILIAKKSTIELVKSDWFSAKVLAGNARLEGCICYELLQSQIQGTQSYDDYRSEAFLKMDLPKLICSLLVWHGCCTHLDEVHEFVSLVLYKVIELLEVSDTLTGLLPNIFQVQNFKGFQLSFFVSFLQLGFID